MAVRLDLAREVNVLKGEQGTDALIGSAYEAAFDPALWPDFLRAMNERLGTTSSCIFLHDFADSSAPQDLPDTSLAVLEGFDPTAWDRYLDHFCHLNVWAQNEERLPRGIAVTSSMLFPDQLLPKTEFGADWLRPQDLFYALGGIVDRKGSVGLKMSFVRSRRMGEFDDDALSLWQRMMPHVQRAADLHRRLAQADQRASDAEAALSLLGSGVVLLGANGQVRSINAAAEKLLNQARGLMIDLQSHLVAAQPEANRALQREIFLATHPGAMPGSEAQRCPVVELRGRGGTLHVSMVPLHRHSERVPVFSSAVAFLDVTDKELPDLTAALMSAYRMTRAQACLVSALVGGLSPRQYAERRGVSLSTVRTQLASATGKAGAKRQVDLARIVLTGPAMLGQGAAGE